jgi:hypothetical protein
MAEHASPAVTAMHAATNIITILKSYAFFKIVKTHAHVAPWTSATCLYVCVYLCNICMYVCMYVCVYVYMYPCMYACMYVCV